MLRSSWIASRILYSPQTRRLLSTARRNVLFFGTDDFSVTSLKRLCDHKDDAAIDRIEVVTTPPQTNSRRKRKGQDHANCIPVHLAPQRPRRKESVSSMKVRKVYQPPHELWDIPRADFDLGIVISFGLFIPSEIINQFPLGCVNVHPSLLPKFRGAAPIHHTLLRNEQETGVSIIQVHPEKFDTGNLLDQVTEPVHWDDTYNTLHHRLAALGADRLLDTVINLDRASSQPQGVSVTQAESVNKLTILPLNKSAKGLPRAPAIHSKAGKIKNFEEFSSDQLWGLWRALGQTPGVYTWFQGKRFRIVTMLPPSNKNSNVGCANPGEIEMDAESNALIIGTASGEPILVTHLQADGKGLASAKDFYNGYLRNRDKILWKFGL